MSCESYYEHVNAHIASIHSMIDEVKELTTKNAKNLGNKIEIIHSKFKNEVDFFQEQPHLLDADIHQFVSKLLQIIRNCYREVIKDQPKTDLAFCCLYLITKVRGFKNVIRHFPHEVSDVEPVMEMISLEDPLNKTNFETKYVLLLWLSVLVLIPLDLKRFDAIGTTAGKSPLIERIFIVIKVYLNVNLGVTKYAASFLAAKFITRPEIEGLYLEEFVCWCLSNVKPVVDRCQESEIMTSQLMALHYFFKIGKREILQQYGRKVLKAIQDANLRSCKDDNLLKCVMKLVQRIGLCFLKTKIAPWRYQRGKRFIEDQNTVENLVAGGDRMDIDDNCEEDDDCAFEELEDVIDILLSGLRSSSTIIRWSSAKGIGRICNRLPKRLAVSVLDCILELFTHRENNCAWHAGCLTLAEMGRRGLILPEDLPRVFLVVKKGLIYDEYKGCCSVGSDVRDAACYVCWSFARAYDKETMKPFVNDLATSLIITSLFDREVNCRRAAAAAFQENVGRQGAFPNGIEIITTIDYQSVGQKKNCFNDLVSYISKFQSYHEPLTRHLIDRKVNHWDPEIRQLASEALHQLTLNVSSDIVSQIILPGLYELLRSSDINSRHGALLSLAQVIYAFRKISKKVPQDLIDHISGLSSYYEDKNYFKITGSEWMKQGCCSFILECSLSEIPMSLDTINSWINIIKTTIAYVNPTTRTFGVRCLNAFCAFYLKDKTSISESFFESLLGRIRDMEEGVRCGSFESISEIPIDMISHQNRKLFIDIAINYILSEKANDKSMTEARAAAITCVTNFLIKLTVEKLSSENELFEKQLIQVYKHCLIHGMNDYTIGSRGDIGFIVRKHSLLGIHDLTVHLIHQETKYKSSIFSEELLVQILGSVLTLCVTNQEWMRVLAAQIFIALIQSLTRSSNISHVPHMKEMLDILKKIHEEEVGEKRRIKEERFEEDEIVTSADPASCLDTFTQFLPFSHFTRNLWLGLVPSLGGIAIGTCKQSRNSVSKILRQFAEKKEEVNYRYIFMTLLELFEENVGNARLSLPFLKTYHFLISGGHLDCLGDEHVKNVITTTWTCTKTSSEAAKKIEGASLLCSSLKYEGCALFAARYVVIFLCSQMRPVRIATADSLQVALMTYGENFFVESTEEVDEKIEKCSTLIRETDWGDSVAKLKEVRNQICLLLNIKPPASSAVGPDHK